MRPKPAVVIPSDNPDGYRPAARRSDSDVGKALRETVDLRLLVIEQGGERLYVGGVRPTLPCWNRRMRSSAAS
jgi:hypothetical protein